MTSIFIVEAFDDKKEYERFCIEGGWPEAFDALAMAERFKRVTPANTVCLLELGPDGVPDMHLYQQRTASGWVDTNPATHP
jgi:hypothetical protein